MRTLLIDGDILVYKAAFGAEEVHSFDDETFQSSANMSKAVAYLEERERSLMQAVNADAVVYALSDQAANWRKLIYEPYKRQRTKTRKPVLLQPMREHVLEKKRTYLRDTLEADDVLGILMTNDKIIKGTKIIASIDKDLLQIPGRHIDIDSGKKWIIREEDGAYRHLHQTLTGDVVDNYPGCPGIGPKTADAVLEDIPIGLISAVSSEAWNCVVKAFESKGHTEADALVQARVARICRTTDYDFKTKAVIPWSPPS